MTNANSVNKTNTIRSDNNTTNTNNNNTMSAPSTTKKSFAVNDASQDIPIFLRSKYRDDDLIPPRGIFS